MGYHSILLAAGYVSLPPAPRHPSCFHPPLVSSLQLLPTCWNYRRFHCRSYYGRMEVKATCIIQTGLGQQSSEFCASEGWRHLGRDVIQEGKLNLLSHCKHPCAGRDYSIVMLRYFKPISGCLRIRSNKKRNLVPGNSDQCLW